ncbi:MAG: translocation/assembly module TamB [Bacteroidales bacterium]|nr:translocation/assembly module TamB [Bacteroidales bacterium]
MFTFLFVFRNPLVQTILARMATSYLTEELQTTVTLDKLDIHWLKSVKLHNLLIKDQRYDSLFFAKELSINLDKPVIYYRTFKPESVELEQGHFRLRNYREEQSSNLRFLIDFFTPSDTNKQDTTPVPIELNKLLIRDFEFSYFNENEEKTPGQIDFNDILVKGLTLSANDLYVMKDSVNVLINQISLREKSGFVVDSLSGDFIIHPQVLQARNLKIVTPSNNLDLDLKFSYNSFDDFSDFVDKIKIETLFRPSRINLAEVGYFAPVMYPMDNEIRLTADINGTVSNFRARDLKFGTGRQTQFRGEVRMDGLPDITETFTHLSIGSLETSIEDVRNFRLPTENGKIEIPEVLDPFGKVKINGKFTGFYNDFVSYAQFRTDAGKIETDLLLRVNEANDVEYHGSVAASDFYAGKFTHTVDYFSKLDLKADIDGSGLSFDDMYVTMEGEINSLHFFDNVYNKIKINGTLAEKEFTGILQVRDEHGNLDFAGSLDYSSAVPRYKFTANIRNAYLQQINLLPGNDSSILSTNLNINFMGNDVDNMQGIIIIDSTLYQEKGKRYFMNDFTFSVTRDSTEYAFIRIFSDFFDATMEGEFTLRELPDNFLRIANLYLDTLVSDADWAALNLSYQDFIFSIELKNTSALSKLFIPELHLAPGTRFNGGFNSRIQNLFFDGNSPEITYHKQVLKKWYSEFYISDENINLKTGANELFVSDTLIFDSLMVDLQGAKNTVAYKVNWKDDKDHYAVNKGALQGAVKIISPERYRIRIDDAKLMFYDTLWSVTPGNFVMIDSNLIHFSNLELKSKLQQIRINGLVSPDPADTLSISFADFKLSNFDVFLKKADVDLDGTLNGNLSVIDYYNDPFYLSDIHINDLYFNKEKLGEVEMITEWDPRLQAFIINGSIIYVGNIGESETLGLEGKFYPNKKNDNFDIALDLNKYKLKTLEPLLSSFSSEIEGLASGKLRLKGSRDKPDLTGNLSLADAAMRIDYLNVKYYFAGDIPVNHNNIVIDNIILYDSLANKATLSGNISHDYLRDFNFNLHISTDYLAAIHTRRTQNEMFYGNALASGDFSIEGPVSNLRIGINARSEKGTNVKIPVSYGTEVGTSDYIVFVNNSETMSEIDKEKTGYDFNMEGLSLKLDLKVTNDADIQLFMPYNMGNIKARGKGDMIMEVSPTGVFSMEGQYTIDRGSFFFTLQNIINRNFDIMRGSNISWQGDPYNAIIDLKAVYKVKTVLGEYGPPEDSATRVPVDCIISLSKQLLNPEIRFTVEFPDLKDETKQYIYSRLDTTDQAMMSQQMISLLVLNNFSQPTGYTGSVGFNTFSLITNQLNNLLSQISNDFDIGVNYRPGDAMSSREMEVALSTQLWDERVLIDGNVGVKDTESTENTNNIVGEVTIEVKITEDGRFRAKAFNKSNNDILYKNYAPYTQGVGVFYTQEFNRLSDLFGRKKKKTKVRNDEDRSSIE